MRLYSSAVMLCWASNCGVTETGDGTTAEEAVVITVAFIVARDCRAEAVGRVWNAGGGAKWAGLGMQVRDGGGARAGAPTEGW
jgi:hypothetical protein